MKTKRIVGIAVLLAIFFCLTACGGSSTVTVTYKDSDGKVLDSKEVTSGTQVDLYYYPKTGYKVSKYTFEDGESAGSQITVSDDVTIIVYIEPISYTITFDNGLYDDTVEVPEDIACKYDEEVTLPVNEIKNGKKKPAGWHSNSYNNSDWTDYTYYADGEKVKNLTTLDGTTVKLVANFRDADYKVEFATVYYSTDSYGYTEYGYDKDEKVSDVPDYPTRYGYVCEGWYEEGDSTQTVIDFETYKVKKDVKFLPKWKDNKNKIIFKTDHGTAPDALELVSTDYYVSISTGDYKLSETGYDFKGWKDADGKIYYSVSYNGNIKEDIILTAEWEPWTAILCYTSLNSNLETKNREEPIVYGEEITLDKNTFTEDNKRFIGWTTTRNGKKVEYEDGAKFTWNGSTKESIVRLYGVWEKSNIAIGVSGPNISSDDDFALSYNSTTKTLTATKNGITDFHWEIDGKKVEGVTTNTLILSELNLKEGLHSVFVWGVVDFKEIYSKECIIRVEKDE